MAKNTALDPATARLLAYSAVGAVWLFAFGVGMWVGLDLGRAIF